MELTAHSLGIRTETYQVTHEYHVHEVVGLPAGAKAMVVEERGEFSIYRLDVPIYATARRHNSMESALRELESSISSSAPPPEP